MDTARNPGAAAILGLDALDRLSAIWDQEFVRLILAGFDTSEMPVALFRPDDSIAYANEAYRVALAVQPDARTFDDIMRHYHTAGEGLIISRGADEWLMVAREKRRTRGQRTFEVDVHDGRWFLMQETCIADGWLWNVMTDITGLKSTERRLRADRDLARRDAEIDPLTGVANRRFGLAELDRQIGITRATNTQLTVVLIDLDRFKEINDTHGHPVGDAVLSHFSETAGWCIRRSDTLARFGGEEFLLIMPGLAAQAAANVLAHVKQRLAALPFSEPLVRYSFSAGIATLLEVDDMQSLLKRADIALYKAKHMGRDCVEIAPL